MNLQFNPNENATAETKRAEPAADFRLLPDCRAKRRGTMQNGTLLGVCSRRLGDSAVAFPASSVRCAMLATLLLMMVGCTTTRINFTGPPGSVLFVGDKPYHLPTQVELGRPGPGQSTDYAVSLVFPTSSRPSQEVRAKGSLRLFGYTESDPDRYAINTCNLDESQLVRILEGTVVIFKGQSASRQPLYDLTLSKQ